MNKLCFIAILLCLPLAVLTARGALERDREYREELKSSCEMVFFAMEKGEMTAEEGKAVLAGLRNRFERPFTDSDGILESLIDQISESRLTALQAMFEFELLSQGKLMSYRQEQEASTGGESGGDGTTSTEERENRKEKNKGTESGSDRESGNGTGNSPSGRENSRKGGR